MPTCKSNGRFRSTVGTLASAAFAVSCGPLINIETPSEVPSLSEAALSNVFGNALAPTVDIQVSEQGETRLDRGSIEASLGVDSVLNVVFRRLSVNAGDTITVDVTATGDEGAALRVVLIRHCDHMRGEDFSEGRLTLSDTPAHLSVSRTFENNFGCVRLSFLASDRSAISFTLNRVDIRMAAADNATTVGP